MQEVSGTIERTKEQLSEIQQQVGTLKDTQPVYLKIRVFTSRVALPPLETPNSPAGNTDSLVKQPADTSFDGTAENTAASADGPGSRDEGAATRENLLQTAKQTEPSTQPNGATGSTDTNTTNSSTAKENGAVATPEGDGKEGVDSQGEEKEEPEIEYEVVETAYVQFTVDRYTEKMGTEVNALQAQVEDLTQRRDAVLEAFKEMAAHFGERPQAVKESEWWSDFLKFFKPFNKMQTAIVKQRIAEQEAAERKRKKEQGGGTTLRQRG